MAKYRCKVCKYIYDEETEAKSWAELPEDWLCPVCGAKKSDFERVNEVTDVQQDSSASIPSPAASKEKKNLICQVCGYLVKEGFTGKVCPACGADKKAFKSHVDKVSRARRQILDFHFHNIMVHFPQAFAVLMFVLLVSLYFIKGRLADEFAATIKILSFFLPLSVLASVGSGLLDGYLRFRRLNTPVLRLKILVGSLFFVFSAALLVLLNFNVLSSVPFEITIALSGLCVLSSLFLGFNGGRLSGNIVAG